MHFSQTVQLAHATISIRILTSASRSSLIPSFIHGVISAINALNAPVRSPLSINHEDQSLLPLLLSSHDVAASLVCAPYDVVPLPGACAILDANRSSFIVE